MNIYWDIQNHRLLSDVQSGQVISRLDWILRDQVPVTLYICQPNTSGGYTVQEAPAGFSVVFGVKATYAGALIAYQATWTLSGSGTGATYPATVDLNTTEAIAAVAAETDSELDAIAEFTLQDSGGVNRDSTQVDCRITQDINIASDSPPLPVALSNMARWSGGNLQLKDITTGFFHTLYLESGTIKQQAGEE